VIPMKYCRRCVMPDTRPGITFIDGVCSACINYEAKQHTDWDARWQELQELVKGHKRVAVALSGGKDSHFQVHVLKELLGLDVVGLSVDNFSWTEAGKKNLQNISESFGIDIIIFSPNRAKEKEMSLRTLYDLGSPMWYADACIYAFPYRQAMQMGMDLLVYGENVAYEYGGPNGCTETPSALDQIGNGVVKKYNPEGVPSSIYPPSRDAIIQNGLKPIYLSYYVKWDSYHNYQVAIRDGFSHMEHEWKREGTIENYNQIDSPGYLINQWFKYPKYGHASVTEMCSRYIRAGLMTREEAIPLVRQKDGVLDQRILEDYCNFVGISKKEFWQIADRWYNTELFEQDKTGVWKPKFEVK